MSLPNLLKRVFKGLCDIKTKIKTMKKFITYLFIFVFGFIFVSLWSFWLIIQPKKITTNRTPSNYSLFYETIEIETIDEKKLSGWMINSDKEEKKAVIFLHGYPADKSDMLDIAAYLHPEFSLLLLDLRYFGESEGFCTTLGAKEREDVKRAIDFLENKGFENIGIFGFSFGGAIGIQTASEDKRVKALASYAAYSDTKDLGLELYRNLPVLKYPLIELMSFWSKTFFKTSIKDLSPKKAAENIDIPVFLIHTKQDELISFKHVEVLKEKLKNNKNAEFYFPDEGLHGELPIDFNEKLKDFFIRSF